MLRAIQMGLLLQVLAIVPTAAVDHSLMEDFEDGVADGFTVRDGTAIVQQSARGDKALLMDGFDGCILLPVDLDRSQKITISGEASITWAFAGDLHVNFLYDELDPSTQSSNCYPASGYDVEFFPQGSDSGDYKLHERENLAWNLLDTAPDDQFSANEWFKFRVTIENQGSSIEVWVNDSLVMSGFGFGGAAGGVALRSWGSVWIDNLEITQGESGKVIFAGFLGSGPSGVGDKPNREIHDIWVNEEIEAEINRNVPTCSGGSCDPSDMEDLKAIAAENPTGGIFALGFFALGTVNHRSIISESGNSDVMKADIVASYEEGDRILAAGFSTGGGDLQNLLEKLNQLDIPVVVSGHIDSVERGSDDDKMIPPNTRIAVGYHQKQSIPPLRGEDELTAVDPEDTEVNNYLVIDPVGPERTLLSRHHRNMDNDIAVWGDILSRYRLVIQSEVSGATSWRMAFPSDGVSADIEGLSELTAGVVQPNLLQSSLHDYATSTDSVRRERLLAMLNRMSTKGTEELVFREASRTSDIPLFVNLVYSLGNGRDPVAGPLLMRLVEENAVDGQGLSAVRIVLAEVLSGGETDWLGRLDIGGLTARELLVLARAGRAHWQKDSMKKVRTRMLRRAAVVGEDRLILEYLGSTEKKRRGRDGG